MTSRDWLWRETNTLDRLVVCKCSGDDGTGDDGDDDDDDKEGKREVDAMLMPELVIVLMGADIDDDIEQRLRMQLLVLSVAMVGMDINVRC